MVMDKFADEFMGIHQIPYVVGAVDGSHIPIVAPRLHAADYYNRKGFLQYSCRGLCQVNAFSGITISGGQVLCTTRIYGHGPISGSFVSHDVFLRMPS